MEITISIRSGSHVRQTSFVASQARNPVLAIACLFWIAVVAVQGALLALHAFGLRATENPPVNFATPQLLAAAAFISLSCLLVTLVVRWLRPSGTLPVAFSFAALMLIAAAVSTRSLGSLLVPFASIVLAWLLGDIVLRCLPPTADAPIVRLPVATAIGLGLLGLLLFLLATLSALNATTILGGAILILLLLLAINRPRLLADLAKLRSWRTATPSWFETVMVGLAAGSVAFAMLAAFVPEVMGSASDAMRQHLPIAREIWQTGSIPEFPQLFVSRQPIQGHLFFAVAYGLGGVTAAKLLQAFLGLVAIAAVGGIGWLGAGRLAATASAVIFATIPIAMWNIGHLYADLIAVLFTATAAICILLWQRDNATSWLIVAGALLGFGFATKVAIALLIFSFAIGIFLVGRSPWQLRERILAVGAFGLGTLVVAPWLVRSYAITGNFPGLSVIYNQLAGLVQNPSAPIEPNSAEAVAVAPVPTGIGLSPIDLVLGPWTLTFDGAPRSYRVIMEGEFGIGLLMLLPLALLGPHTRAKAFLALTVAVSYLGWAVSDQISRHLLPILAIAAPLVGIGVANAVSAASNRPRQLLATATRTGLVLSCLAGLLFFLPNHTTRLPVDLILGRETAAEYIDKEVWAISSLTAATEMLPPDTRVGYIGLWEGPQAYTEARLVFLGTYWADSSSLLDDQLGTTPEEVLTSLDQRDLKYFIWDRPNTRPEDWGSTLLSGDFLRDHSRIIEGDRDAYLFEVLPDGKDWGEEHLRNLLDNPGLKKIRKHRGPWTTVGNVKATGGVVSMTSKSSLAQRVPVSGGSPYLLIASSKCANAPDRAELTLRWFDDDGVELGAVTEAVVPSLDWSEQFVWHRAPISAGSVSAELAAGLCELDKAALYRLS